MNHRYAKDEKEAAYKGIKAGLDMEMVSECYSKSLVSLVKEGKVSIKLVDDAVRRILEQKYKLDYLMIRSDTVMKKGNVQ